MKLPSWLIGLVRPVYKALQRIPVIGPGIRKLAIYVLTWEPSRLDSHTKEKKRLAEIELQIVQYGLIIQGLDHANRSLCQKNEELKALIQHEVSTVRERVEFVRDEQMFELRKALKINGPSSTLNAKAEAIKVKVLTSGCLSLLPLKLNLGCGQVALPDYVNVDGRELPGVDLVADVTSLPIDPSSVDEIFASHLIEHFPLRFLLDVLLPYWCSLLKSEGRLRLVLPDAEGMIQAYAKGEMSFDDLNLVTFGKQDYDGDFHFVMFSVESMSRLLKMSGFTSIQVIAENRVNGLCREMEIVATKGAGA